MMMCFIRINLFVQKQNERMPAEHLAQFGSDLCLVVVVMVSIKKIQVNKSI